MIKINGFSCICVLLWVLSVCLWLYSPLLDLGRFFSSQICYTVCRTPSTGDQSVTRPLPTHRRAQTQNKSTQTSMPQVGFETTISAFERSKTVHTLDRTATVIDCLGDLDDHLALSVTAIFKLTPWYLIKQCSLTILESNIFCLHFNENLCM
jgi:hypothetical protein